MHKFLLITFALIVVPISVSAAFNDVTLTTDVVINIAGINLNVSGSSAVVESITVNASDFSFVLQSGSSIQVTSTDRKVLSTDAAGQYIDANTCTASESALKHSSSVAGSVTITVTPQSATCTVATSVSSGGGSVYIAGMLDKPTGPFSISVNSGAAITKTSEVKLEMKAGSNIKRMAISSHKADLSDAGIVDYQPIATWDLCSKFAGSTKYPASECGEGLYTVYVRFYTSSGQPSAIFSDTVEYKISGVSTLPASAGTQSVAAAFLRTLRLGSVGDDVKLLQKLLNANGIIVANTGQGSPGNEGNYFGILTEKAVQKFQSAHNIAFAGGQGYGRVGPKTRAKLNEVSSQARLPADPPPVSVTQSFSLTRTLSLGSIGKDVKALQQFLNSSQNTRIAETGVGSHGNETEYFGTATERAVKKFQIIHNLAASGDSGYGYVGPKTRAKLKELFGN
jgi:peptidoglycan hydrolase-like protein with peptidoglycan-binding domain